MKWTQIKVHCKPADLDAVCAAVSMVDTHMMIEDFSDVVECNPVYGELIDESLLARRDEAAVSIYVSQTENCAEVAMGLENRLRSLAQQDGRTPESLFTLETIPLDEEDWANNWKQYYKPVKIGERLVIVPEWEEYAAAPEEVTVTMDPGMAFGTGTHETTRLCATLLEAHMETGSRVLDIGTGSGILAICASELGAASVDAFDIDPMAVRVAQENVARNGCNNVRVAQSDLLAAVTDCYDLAVANITADILIRMAPDAARVVRPGGLLAVSGVIDDQTERVKAAMRDGGFECREEMHDRDWAGLLFFKPEK